MMSVEDMREYLKTPERQKVLASLMAGIAIDLYAQAAGIDQGVAMTRVIELTVERFWELMQ